jgi:protein SCO1
MIRLSQALKRFIFGLIALALVACQNKPVSFHGADIKGAPYGQSWRLTDQTGQTRQAKDFKGHVQLVFFGFTHCPDICPGALHRMQSALQLIPADDLKKHPVDILFITVDPDTDTVAAMGEYLKTYDVPIVGLTGSLAELESAAKDFKVYAQQSPQNSKMFEHSGFIYAMDMQGKARLLYAPETPAKDIAEDVRNLMAEG